MASAELVAKPDAAPPAIRSPLDRLRGTIHKYVALEGLAWAGILLALWFWIGLLLDYGVFRTFHFDWVQEAPRGLRVSVLIVMLAGLAALVLVKIVRRLMVEFRPSALALVLERRFPDLLGDRLITAVELADADRAQQQGYSRALVEKTVHDAALRVAQAPVESVFDWRRLRRLGWWLIGLTLGLTVLVVAASAAFGWSKSLPAATYGFRDAATIWFERNVLLWNTIWPRRAHLELVGFPESGDLHVGRDAAAAPLRIRAVKWVVADSKAPEGWRAMTWADLSPGMTGSPIPDAGGAISPTERLDDLERRVRMIEGGQSGPDWTAEFVGSLAPVFEALSARSEDPAMARRFRRLEVPQRVEISTWGEKTANDTPFPLGSDQEYSGTLTELKESVSFRVRAEDYRSAIRQITLVPPPTLTSLSRNEERPAYLYHRPPIDAGLNGLRGLRQHVRDQAIALSGAVSQFSVPVGANVELFGTLDKELSGARLLPITSKGEPAGAAADMQLTPERLGFLHRFENVQSNLDFEIEFTDTDQVHSRRHVLIEAVRDTAPTVNVALDGIRKTGAGYMVTPSAMIPIIGTVADGYGLAAIEYALTVVRLETAGTLGAQSGWAVTPVGLMGPLTLPAAIVSAASVHEVSQIIVAASPTPKPYTFSLKSFDEIRNERAARDLVLSQLQARLAGPLAADSPHIVQFEVKPKFEYLDLRERLRDLKVRDEQQIQPRYRIKLTVNASDFNVESGPGVGTNKEPPFTVLVVSEPELLVEIANDERNLHFKMEDAISRLKDARLRIEKIAEELPGLDATRIPTMALRAQEVQDAALRSRDTSQEVLNEFQRLLREMELNRVMPKLVEKVRGEIVFPLEGALRQEFVAVDESTDRFRKDLEAGTKSSADPVKTALDRLIERLNRVMDAMGEIKGINDLITTLRAIEKGQEQDIGAVLRRIKKEKEEELLRKIGDLK